MVNEEVAVTLAKHDKDIKSLEHRMSDVEETQKNISDLTASVRELTINLQHMVEEQKRQSERLTKLEDEPLEKSKTIKTILLSAAVTGIVSIIVGIVIGWLAH